MNLLLKDILSMAEARFTSEGCLTPRLDAELLFCHLIEKDKSWLFLHYGDKLNDKICEDYFKLVDIRAGGMPLQYITGSQEFMGLDFAVNENVLIPRQDTEILVEKALDMVLQKKMRRGGHRILDLCCGSGAIAISLAYYLGKKKRKVAITASDISANALSVAKNNAASIGVEKSINFVRGDLFAPFPKNRKGKGKQQFEIIISNPPYIPTNVLPTLMREVRNHEPLAALDGGIDGLDFYKRIIAEAYLYLENNGLLLLEIGHDQGEALSKIVDETGAYCPAEVIKDHCDNDRVAIIKVMDNGIQS